MPILRSMRLVWGSDVGYRESDGEARGAESSEEAARLNAEFFEQPDGDGQ